MASTRKALVEVFVSKYLTLTVQFFSVVIIARLLTPEEIGIFSLGAAFVSLAHLLRDFGSAQYVVQEAELTTDRIRAALAVTLGLGWAVALTIYLGAPYVAAFYENEATEKVLRLLSLNFFLLPFSTVNYAYLRREMNFFPSAVAGVSSAVIEAVVAVTLAFAGFSFLSLAWGAVAGTATMIVIGMFFRPKELPWLPGFAEVGRVFAFGGRVGFINVITEVSRLLPEFVLGKAHGFSEVGMYSRAYGVVRLFQRLILGGLSAVLGAKFAMIRRENEDMHRAYLHVVACVSCLACLFYLNLFVLAEPFVLIVYGDQWTQAIELIRPWALVSVIGSFTMLSERLLTNVGEVKRVVRMTIIMQPIRILVVGAACVKGLEYIVWGLFVVASIRTVIYYPQLRQVFSFTAAEFFTLVTSTLVPCVIGAAGTMLTMHLLFDVFQLAQIVAFVLASVVGFTTWTAMVFLTKHPLHQHMGDALSWGLGRIGLGGGR